MNRLAIVSDSIHRADVIGRQLAGIFHTQSLTRQRLPDAAPANYTIVDIDLEDSTYLPELRLWLELRPKCGKAIFAVERDVRYQAVQAYAIGATELVNRPVDRATLLTALFGDIGALVGDPTAFSIGKSDGISAAIGTLQRIFDSGISGAALDLRMVHAASETVVANIEADGLVRWINIVRQHHSQTYQHCLLVTGIAVAFGRQLGFTSADKCKLALAGLLHDIGKARVPVALLEKPSPLTPQETAIMQQHPLLGLGALQAMPGIDPDMLDMVVHHHEYLDGSGYPHGLHGRELSDLVRMMTIADVFGALIERRAYREPLTATAAYQILLDMGPKLDKDLVREFRIVSPLSVKRS